MRRIAPYILFVFVPLGCVEEFQIQSEPNSTIDISQILVVDATLTDQLKKQEVLLSRGSSFANDSIVFAEENAEVSVGDNQGNMYRFIEEQPGIYISQSVFAAEQGKSYQLFIVTSDGKNYSSAQVSVPENIPIGEVRAERIFNGEDREGVGIFVKNFSSNPEPSFFRYEFDETYKIIAPRWDPFRFEVIRNTPCVGEAFVVDIVTWEDERRTCFGTSKSQGLIQAASVDLQDGTNNDFRLHFLTKEDYIISHRYSINVTQYTQTQEAYSFYERLGDFSSSEDIFSQVQPGFLEGNISLESSSNEMVLGYFEVASVSEKRMYFNYEDLFPSEPLPPYPINCETFGNPPLIPPGYTCLGPADCEIDCDSQLIEQILAEEVVFASEKDGDMESPYYTWPSPCGDCTKLGSNVVPEFWSEE